MRSPGSGTTAGIVIGLALIAAAFFCIGSLKGVAIHSIDIVATSEARPPSVGERAEAIRQETRLDNPQGIPTGFWVMGFIAFFGLAYLLAGPQLFEAIANRDKQKRLLNKNSGRQMPAQSPYQVIDQPQFPEFPQPATRPRLPQSPDWPQLPGGSQ